MAKWKNWLEKQGFTKGEFYSSKKALSQVKKRAHGSKMQTGVVRKRDTVSGRESGYNLYTRSLGDPVENFRKEKASKYKPGNKGFVIPAPNMNAYAAAKVKRPNARTTRDKEIIKRFEREERKNPKVKFDTRSRAWKYLKPKKGYYD